MIRKKTFRYIRQITSIEELHQSNIRAVQSVAELSKYALSLVDEYIFKTDREMKRYFVHMSEEGKAYHQRQAHQYTEHCNTIVIAYTNIIKFLVLEPNLYYHDFNLWDRFGIPYKDLTYCYGPLERIDMLTEECKEVLKLATRDYWFAVLKWLRGDY